MGDYATLLKIITDYFREYNDDITYQELLEKVHFIFQSTVLRELCQSSSTVFRHDVL